MPWAGDGHCGQELSRLELAHSWDETRWRSTLFKLDIRVGSLPGAESHAESRHSYFLFSFVQSGELGGDPCKVNSWSSKLHAIYTT